MRSAQEGVIVFDADRRYLVWNPFMEQSMGVPARDVLGKRTEDVFPSLARLGVVDAQQRALAGESIVMPDVQVTSPHSGERYWCSLHYSPLRDDAGRIAGVICIVRDITERKAVEEQLRHSQKMEAIGRLAGGETIDGEGLASLDAGP